MKQSNIFSALATVIISAGILGATAQDASAYDNRCAGMNKQMEKLSQVVKTACKATKSKECSKIDSDKSKEFQKVASDFVKEWNKVVGNSSLKIGARYFDLGKSGNGTIQSTQRMWVSKGIATKNTVEIKLSELDGKLHVGAHICLLEPGKKTPTYKKTVFFNANASEKGNKKQSKTIKVSGAKGKIVMFKIAAQKPSTNKFKYKFTSKNK